MAGNNESDGRGGAAKSNAILDGCWGPPEGGRVQLPDYFKDGYLLVADDSANMQKTLRNVLGAIGVKNVRRADNGEEALVILRHEEEPCKFLLLDWNMPRFSGIETALEIRADGALEDIPILMLTAEAGSERIAFAGEIGVNGYLLKPVVPLTLERKMAAVLEARANPPRHVRMLEMGRRLADAGRYDEALGVLEELVGRAEGGARAMVEAGGLCETLGKPEKAMDLYLRATERNPQYLKGYLRVAELLKGRGNREEALVFLKKAAEISPMNAERHMEIGAICMEMRNPSAASEAFKNAIRANPNRKVEIAERFLGQDQPEQAEEFFKAALDAGGDDPHILNRLGIALRRQGKWREAIAAYEKTLKYDPGDEGIYFNMGKAFMEGRQTESARKCFKDALKLNPTMPEAIRALEQISPVKPGGKSA